MKLEPSHMLLSLKTRLASNRLRQHPVVNVPPLPWIRIVLLGAFITGLIHFTAAESAQHALLMSAQIATEPAPSATEELVTESDRPTFRMTTLKGRVVWMSESLEQQFGIREVPEAAERLLALKDASGNLYPLVEDIRGRAFRRDPRLRAEKVELLVRRYEGAPVVQIVQVFTGEGEKRVELDYWCEICAIAMFELKPCDCCQGDIELRRRPAPQARKQ